MDGYIRTEIGIDILVKLHILLMCQFDKLIDIIPHYVDKEGNAVEIETKF